EVGEIPHTTHVHSHIIIRNSCGCAEQVNERSNKPNSLHIDQELEHVFLQSIEKNSMDFIHTLKNRLRRGKVNYYDYQRYISLLRNKISYNLEEDVDKVKRAEELWHLARLAISDSERSWTAKEMFRARRL